jgi:hypothetical protein
MRKQAHLAHQVPGRIRIKIPEARLSPEKLELTRSLFAGIPGLQKVEIKPESASILLHYDPRLSAEFEAQLQRRWAESRPSVSRTAVEPFDFPGDEFGMVARGIEEEAVFLAGRSQLAHAIVEFFKEMDQQVRLATNNAIDFKIVLAVGVTIIAFLEVGVQAATPMWVTLALFALNHFLEMQRPDAAVGALPPPDGLRAVPARA